MRYRRVILVLSLLLGALVILAGCLGNNSSPVASFTASPSSGAAPLKVRFNAAASFDSDGNIATYRWTFGDGGQGTGVTTTHTYTTGGTRSVQLTVTDNNGAQGSITHTIVVTTSPSGPLKILDWRLLPYDNMFMPWVVTGHAKNVSGHTLSYAEVDAQFYDAKNVLLTTWLDNITDLPAGVTWEFNIYCMDSDVASRVDHTKVHLGTYW